MKGNAMTPEEAETKLLAACREAVDAIVDDLSGRSGLGNALDECDSGVQREMRETWTQLVLSELSRLEQSRVERAVEGCDALFEAWKTSESERGGGVLHAVRKIRAILTAPTDSYAGSPERSGPDVTTVAGEPGGRSSLGGYQLLCAVCDSPLKFDLNPDGFCHVAPCDNHWCRKCCEPFAAPIDSSAGSPSAASASPALEHPPAPASGGDPAPGALALPETSALPFEPLSIASCEPNRSAPANPETVEPGGRSSPPPAEVKPSERIRELALLYEAEGLSGPAAIAKATCDYLDEQHARGRK
jgi:hypothetical protein